jgi:hypothetical protein
MDSLDGAEVPGAVEGAAGDGVLLEPPQAATTSIAVMPSVKTRKRVSFLTICLLHEMPGLPGLRLMVQVAPAVSAARTLHTGAPRAG